MLSDKSFVTRQTFSHSRATCHSYGPPLPLPQHVVVGGRETSQISWAGIWTILGRALSLWQKECSHLTHVTMWVRVNNTCALNSYDFNLLRVLSCLPNTKSDAGFSEPLFDEGKPTLLVTDNTMENVKFISKSQLGHLRGKAHEKDVWLFAAELQVSW